MTTSSEQSTTPTVTTGSDPNNSTTFNKNNYVKMKYFTKYLKVGGDLKKGDKHISWLQEQTEHHIFTTSEDFTAAKADSMGLDKVKLFLCSRDIQIGDTFNWIDHKGELNTTFNANEANIGFIINNNFERYKVIGEISPKAIWVEEGMEFEEDAVSITPMYERYSDPVVFKYNQVRIQCPSCKTYH